MHGRVASPLRTFSGDVCCVLVAIVVGRRRRPSLRFDVGVGE